MSEVDGSGREPRPPLVHRLSGRQWVAIDITFAALALALALANLRGAFGAGHAAPRGVGVALVVFAALPVIVRRLWPRAALAVVACAVVALTVRGQSPFVLDLTLAAVTYTVATQFDRRVALAALLAVCAALGMAVVVAAVRHLGGGIHSVLFVISAWFVGDSGRSRREYVAGLREQTLERQRLEDEYRRRAVREERLRIARELHDVVAHGLGVITVQAGVGRRVIEQRPDQARAALEAVEGTGRAASDELRRIVGLLRDDEGADGLAVAPLAPAPGIGELEKLVDQVRAAGVPATLSVEGAPGAVPEALALSAYRIVQEALTNVVKHARGARTTVAVAVGGGCVRLRVVNDRPGAPGLDGDRPRSVGHGLVGMRERATAFGGTLDARATPAGGFEVVAFLPSKGS